jgi:hypothetical protein
MPTLRLVLVWALGVGSRYSRAYYYSWSGMFSSKGRISQGHGRAYGDLSSTSKSNGAHLDSSVEKELGIVCQQTFTVQYDGDNDAAGLAKMRAMDHSGQNHASTSNRAAWHTTVSGRVCDEESR